MKPEIDQILRTSAMQMLADLMPLLPHAHAQGHATLTALMLMLSAEEYDRAADIRAAENADMRNLFAELAPLVRDEALKREAVEAAATTDSSLAISALNQSNDALRRLLIHLHAHLEDVPHANAKIWAVLKAMADRRLVHPPPV